MIYQFDAFTLDAKQFTLGHAGTPVHVEPKIFDLILYLVEHAGKVIGRDTLVEEVWNGRFISDTTLSSAIKMARKALGDSGEKQQMIRTVRGRGFEFVATVDLVEEASPAKVFDTINIVKSEDDRLPALLILPLDTFSHPEALKPVADGIVENLTTILTRIPLLQIASRTAAFAYKEKFTNDPGWIHQQNIDWVLEGSVQKLAGQLRVNLQLIETREGFHIWAQQFDQTDTPDAIDVLLENLLAKLEPQLMRAIFKQVSKKEGEPGSRELLLQAMGLLSIKGWHKDTFEESAELLRRAIEKEPGLALARAYLGLILGLGPRVGLMEKSDDIIQQVEQETQAAMQLDNMDSTIVGLAGCALADIGQAQRAIPILQNAIDLNPNNGHAWAALGAAQMMIGQFDEAIPNLRKGVDISPADGRRAVWCATLAIAHLHAGAVEKAIKLAQEACSYDYRNYIPKVALAGSLLTAGNHQHALSAFKDCYRVKPDLSDKEIHSLVGRQLSLSLLKLME